MSEGCAALPIAALLRAEPRTGRVLGAFGPAVYVAVDDTVVALVAADGLRLPIALVTDLPSFTGVRAGAAATVGDGAVRVGGLTVTATSWWDPRPRTGPADPAAVARLGAALRGHPSAVADRLPPLAAALSGDDPAAVEKAADRLLGFGPGLTPAGDDVLAGALAALRLFAGRGFDLPGRRTTALSAALLACAARGEVIPQVAGLLHALAGNGPVEPAVEALLAVGHSSGRDLAAGIALGAAAIGRPRSHIVCGNGHIRPRAHIVCRNGQGAHA